MKNIIYYITIGLVALASSTFGVQKRPPFQFPEGSLHWKADHDQLITEDELTHENLRTELARSRTYTTPASTELDMFGEEIETPEETVTENEGPALTLWDFVLQRAIDALTANTYASLKNIIRADVNTFHTNIDFFFLQIANNSKKNFLKKLISQDKFAARSGKDNPFPLKDFINFFYGLGLRLDTPGTNRQTLEASLNTILPGETAECVIAAFREVEKEIIPAVTPANGQNIAQRMQQMLNRETASMFSGITSLFGGRCPSCNLL